MINNIFDISASKEILRKFRANRISYLNAPRKFTLSENSPATSPLSLTKMAQVLTLTQNYHLPFKRTSQVFTETYSIKTISSKPPQFNIQSLPTTKETSAGIVSIKKSCTGITNKLSPMKHKCFGFQTYGGIVCDALSSIYVSDNNVVDIIKKYLTSGSEVVVAD